VQPGKNINKILLAEDDDDDFNMFNTAILSLNSDIDILRTENGIMLSSLLETDIKPDVIFLDINLPYKNGLLCLKEIKNKPELSSIRVIMYSTSHSGKDVENSYELGADYYLVKQSSYHGIVSQLNELFQHNFSAGAGRPAKADFLFNSGTMVKN
jgi:DNA-binding response OmpR family regulator